MNRKYFFGWENIKWGLRNLILVYSAKNSFFSKKRIESGIGFIIAEWGMVFWLLKKYDVMTTTDFAIWASIQFFVAGYIINQIEKSKRLEDMQSEPTITGATITTTITTDSVDPNSGEPLQ